MNGQYIFGFSPDSMIDPIIVYPGEFNSATVSNRLNVLQVTSQVCTVYGDFTYRFTTGYQFTLNNVNQSSTCTVVSSQYLPKTTITSISSETSTISILGDGSLLLKDGRVFTIQSSTNNNGKWIAKTSYYDGVTTTIQLASSANGDLIPPSLMDGALIDSTSIDGFVETGVTAIEVAELIDDANGGSIDYIIPLSEVGTSITLPGRGAPVPGEHILRNFIDIMSNFASTTPPINPISGQLWYDMSHIKVWNRSANAWTDIGATSVSTQRSIITPTDDSTLLATPPYVVGAGTLSVYRNGQKLFPGIEYTEVESGLILMTKPTNTGEKFLFEVLTLS